MTRKTAIFAALLTLAWLPLQGLATPAEAADFGFSAWGAFRIGGIDLALGIHEGGPHAHYGPYYRFDRRVAYPGYRCGSACYLDRGVAFHHYSCPVALQHFRTHRVAPPRLGPFVDTWGRRYYRFDPPGRAYGHWSAPRGPVVYYPRWDDRGHHYDRHDHRYDRRYDRRDRRYDPRDRRYDSRDRRYDSHHRHDDSCRHW